VEHRLRHHRLVSAETRHKHIRIGLMRARELMRHIRGSHGLASPIISDPDRELQ
jgi:hypothetical protein